MPAHPVRRREFTGPFAKEANDFQNLDIEAILKNSNKIAATVEIDSNFFWPQEDDPAHNFEKPFPKKLHPADKKGDFVGKGLKDIKIEEEKMDGCGLNILENISEESSEIKFDVSMQK